MIVMKFGGTSVSSKENIDQIKSILNNKNDSYIVIVSAFSGVTNKLEKIVHLALDGEFQSLLEDFRTLHFEFIKELFGAAKQSELILAVQKKCNEIEDICKSIQVLKELTHKTQASITSTGEELSSLIVCEYLKANGVEINLLKSKEIIIANGDHLNAEVDFKTTNQNILETIKEDNYIAGGFIASNNLGDTVVLGRGGSDYSAAIYAAAIDADYLEIWSDINGMHNANPRIVKNTKSIKKLSYEEAFELAYFGAKVLYPPSVLPVMKSNIPVYLKNTLEPSQDGTVISGEVTFTDDKIKGLSSLSNIAIVTVSGVGLAKQKGKARKIFQTLEENNVSAVFITQSCSEQNIGIGIDQGSLKIAEEALNDSFEKEIIRGTISPIGVIKDQCIIALVGDNMRNQIGLSGKAFSAIGENGININAIAQGASERNISIVIDQEEEAKALNVVHERFFSNAIKNVHLFIAGIGNVGKEFIDLIYQQKEKLIANHQINLKIIGVANSKRFMIDEKNGINLSDLKTINEEGEEYIVFTEFLTQIKKLNLRNTVFIDNTASPIVSSAYPLLLKESISVATCNKIACSSDYNLYSGLNQLAKKHNCYFKYETSVGAALPIIKTINDLIISGDKINKIEAVLSGSLNFIFNNYDDQKVFADVVHQAKEEGYTEPNPLIDLSGLDVMRKILILTREAGYEKEINQISFNSFLPDECTNSNSVEALFENLKKNEQYFKSLYREANKKGNKLKVAATMVDGNMSVKLMQIEPTSPFYNLEGKDNVVTLNTNRYKNEPMVIKGAGAGASVTASGVFADLMFIINR